LALTVAPAPSTNPLNPSSRVNGASFALRKEPLGDYAPMVVNGTSLYGGGFVTGGAVSPGPTAFTSGDISGRIYRYVVWRNDTSCPEATCPGTQDYKRVVVAIRLDARNNQASERTYVEVQSDFVDPDDSALNDPIPGADGVVTAQQFFLSDTSCSASGMTTRSEIVASHPLHNTLGTCASGQQVGSTAGAPDALVLSSPPDAEPENSTIPARYDYSNDYPLQKATDAAKGIQLRRDETTGCHYTPTGKSVPQWQVHRWVTDPVPRDFKMNGEATLDIYARAVTDTTYKGALCIYLFERVETGSPPKGFDTGLTNKVGGAGYWEFTPTGNGLWPQGWFEVRQTLSFNGPVTIEKGHRLGLALSVNGNTGGDAIALMYDHPDFRSRVEIETPTPIEVE
jgi:hypothetical protein